METRRAGVGVGHADRQREVGVGEVNCSRAIPPRPFLQPGWCHAMQCLADWYERALCRRVLDRPRFAAVAGAREQVLFWSFTVDVVAFRAKVFEEACAEADQDFIVPRPDAVIRRPATESPRLGENFHVPDVAPGGCFGFLDGVPLEATTP